jgi:uncharacterized membrane protein
MAESKFWNDVRIEHTIGNLLRAGVILAAAVVLAGGVLYVARYGGQKPQYGMFRGEPSDLRNVSQIAGQAISLHSRGLIQLGLLILIATPVARVAFSVLAFAAERDWLYVVVTLIVLAILVYSLTST